MKQLVVVICVLAPFAMAAKKHKPQVVIEVVESRNSLRVHTQPAKTGQSNINCLSNANALDTGVRAADGSANCTTTTDAPPSQPAVTRISEVQVQAIMPDGRRITLFCQQGRRSCGSLIAGSYEAEVDGNSAWVYVPDPVGARGRKIKYRFAGGSTNK